MENVHWVPTLHIGIRKIKEEEEVMIHQTETYWLSHTVLSGLLAHIYIKFYAAGNLTVAYVFQDVKKYIKICFKQETQME